ncbi:MAG: DUF1292 domain-containing protein [Lachnospiraceae bacterium]|nr:DUF1292 domain-containing protein [Lachnospiraceae bacterium]
MNYEDFEDTITMEYEDGTSEECEILAKFLGYFNGEEREYVALNPLDSDDEETIYLYRAEYDEDENLILVNIESDEELEIAADAFEELIDETDLEAMLTADEIEEMKELEEQ